MNELTSLIAEYLEDATGHLDAAESHLMLLESSVAGGGGIQGEITTLLGIFHTLKGNSGMMGFASVQRYVHALESLLKRAGEGDVSADPIFMETLFGAVNSLRRALGRLAEDPAATLDFSDEQQLLECLASGALQGGELTACTPERRDDFAYVTQKSSTLKVNFEKLDELLNLVGELVIHRTALVALEDRLKEAGVPRGLMEAFGEASQLVGKSAGELRESIMKARMLPVKVVFQRFNRMVRDLSQRHGKEIRLVFSGEETEIDKTVIDEIGEPLLHLLRNAVDHGIETPGERRLAGKAPQGTLTLSACHESNHIVISLQDDGRGIVADSLRRSAVAKGLMAEAEAEALSDQEAFQLMFLPGFSTAGTVTETSGRGIGLDVVKKIVARFNGVIDVDSRPGEGSCFTLRLPLTLAIIQALMVQVGGETLAIPLSGVLESIKVQRDDIHLVGESEMVRLRDRLLVLVRVAERFGLQRSDARDSEYVVVVGSGEKRAGLVVDRLLGQQEVVIKALDDYLGDLPGIAGGTVLGDGRVSLILDIAALVASTR